jgi:uncharacterized membrane protein (TIGR02234 family)
VSATTPASPRRQLTYAVLLCLAGAGLALFAATRTWAVEVTPRPGVLPDLREARTGADAVGWLPALAVAELAGAGALLATRGVARRMLGAVLVLAGAGMVAGAAYGLATVDRGAAGGSAAAWPVLCLVGGLVAAAGGALTLARGHTWPAMGTRYERTGTGTGTVDRPGAADPQAGPAATRQAWDALDRGEDPTLT